MNKILNKYLPMTETAFYILLVLKNQLHGYGIILAVEELTSGRIRIGAGTIYGTLTKMEKDGVVVEVDKVDRRKIYIQSEIGKKLISHEIARLYELIESSKKGGY